MMMNIASLSVVQHQQKLQTDVSTALMGKVMDFSEATSDALLDMLETAVPAPPSGGMDILV